MRHLAIILSLVLGFTLLAAHPASAAVAASLENRASGSAAVADTRVSQNTRLSEEAVRENLTLRYDLASDSPVAAEGVAPLADESFHYTFGKYLSSIETNGLRAGSYATDAGELSPLQAQIDLALPPNRGLPDALLRIDLNGLRGAGYEIPSLTPAGRMFNMPGGGMEMQFPYSIPPEFISVIK